LIDRNAYSAEEARRRIQAQSPVDEKIARADVVIENDGALQELRDRIDAAWMESIPKRIHAGYLLSGYES
jgi:dephospho-CoA kinase